MDITAFIRELLFGHDCVIVPGFGGFVGNYTPARIDKLSGTFYPPIKQISFNRNLNHNDGLLIKKICSSSGLNYGDARSMVEEFVSGLRKKLEKGEKVVFDNIGVFINNQEGNVQFEPDQSINYHLDSYGLESFQCFPLEGYDVRKRVIRNVEKDPVKRSSIRKHLWRAAVIIPLLGTMVVVSLKTDLLKARIETTSMNPLVSAEIESNRSAIEQTLQTQHEQIAENIIQALPEPEPEQVAPEAPEVIMPVTSQVSYFIITGSFKSEQNADNQVEMLKSAGYTPEIVTSGNGFYRVCATVCNDLNSAMTRKDSISKKFPGAWISRKK